MRRRSRLAALVLATSALLTAACGARLTDEQLATALGDGGGAAGVAAGGPSPVAGQTTTTIAGQTATPGAAGDPGTVASGGGAAVDGGATGGEAAAGGPCTPQPSTEVGVTDTEIRIGSVSTISGPVAGLGATGVNGIKAYFNYINSEGGVCGRQLVLDGADDRLDTGVNRSEAERLRDRVFGFTTGLSPVDGGSASALGGTNIPVTGLVISDGAVAASNFFSPIPIDPSGASQGTGGIWQYFRATQGITKVAIVYPAQADARARAFGYIPDIEAAGLQVDGPYEVSVTETNYVSVAQRIENSGADAVITALEVTGISRLAQAFAQIGYAPKVPFYGSQTYGQQFLELAGGAAEGTRLGVQHLIFEDAPSAPVMATFLDWYGRTNPGSEPDFFAIMGWAAADMMVQALEAAGPAPTRDAALAFLQGLQSFDAHGIIAAANPAGKRPAATFMVVTVQGGQWVREYPAGGGFGNGS